METIKERKIVKSLPVMERFYTIQGEGHHQGKAAYFIRLGGCDVGCTWCDVKESWDASKHPKMDVEDLVEAAAKFPCRLVVITGGEPLMYDLTYLTQQFQAAGFRTHVETSGAHPLSGSWDWICLSPKKFKFPLEEFYPHAHELKIIVFNKHDFKWAEEHAAHVNESCTLLLQPEWSKEKQMLPLMIDYVKENPQWQISLQTHKYMDVP
ncbi:MAG: 7-carboxy-7-deazaguanine synthase [Maribacter sp.]|jgi:7-carboxy-7-deazaguanine synthase